MPPDRPAPDPAPIAPWRSYRRLMPFVWPYRGALAAVLAVSFVSTALSLVQPYLSKLMIDVALARRDMTALSCVAAAMVVAALVGFALNIVQSRRYAALSAAMLFDMRVALLAHLQRLGPRFYGRSRLGDIMSRINGDVGTVQRTAADTVLAVLGNVLFLIGCVAMMAWLNLRLFIAGMVLTPLAVAIFLRFQQRVTMLTREMRERGADVSSLLIDSVLGMRMVVALGAERIERDRFAAGNQAYVATMLKMQVASILAAALPGTLLTASSSVVMLYGGWLIFHDRMTLGALVAFMAYHMRVFGPIQALLGLSSALASTRVSLARIFELFDVAPQVSEPADPRPIAPLREALRFEGVSFRHDRAPILNGLDLAIPAGRFCAILGESGAGKSTMADLMIRFLDPDAGRILYDGIDLRAFALNALRREILLVDQAPHLFNATIAENIAFATPEADAPAIRAAAEAAGLLPVLARLPDGLDTTVGERGLALSAGERQRIALARAMLRRPSVLILDEPTSALDAETEADVAARLRSVMAGATIIVITHKPALAAYADMTVTLKDGRASVTNRRELMRVDD